MVTNGSEDGTRPAYAGRVPSGSGPVDARAGANGDAPLLRLRGIGKSFGPVQALTGIDLDIPAGQVTALVGDNGAGKTHADQVHRRHLTSRPAASWCGTASRCTCTRRRDATNLGIATVYQDLALADNLDIVQNMLLGHEMTRFGLLDEINMELTAKQTLQDLRVTTVRSIRQPVGSLSGGQRQAVAVAKAVMQDAQAGHHGRADRRAGRHPDRAGAVPDRTAGQPRSRASWSISHNLTDVFQVADRIAVLYLGRLVAVGPAAEFDTPVGRGPDDHGRVEPAGQRQRERAARPRRQRQHRRGGLSNDISGTRRGGQGPGLGRSP